MARVTPFFNVNSTCEAGVGCLCVVLFGASVMFSGFDANFDGMFFVLHAE